jgi:hypothetical protein
MTKVPVRYVGEVARILKESGGERTTDGDGNPLSSNLVVHGQTLLIPDTEAFGFTEKYETFGLGTGKILGVGRVILPEHSDLDSASLRLAGYVFHEGRSDFEPLVPPPASEQPKTSRNRKADVQKEGDA